LDRARTLIFLSARNRSGSAFLHALSKSPPLLSLPQIFHGYLNESLAQRPAGSIGKDGQCNLSFVAAQGQTRLSRSYVTHPFHLTSPWRLDPALPGMAVVYLQTPAGGLIQGDRASMQFTFGPQTQVHLTTQAAEKIHSMTANCAVQRASFTLGAGAYVEYCPEPLILFPGSRFAQGITVTLEQGASAFLSEIFLSRSADDGSSFEAFTSTLRVYDVTKGLLLQDRGLALPRQHSLNGIGVLGGCKAWGQAFLVGPIVSPIWIRELHTLLTTETEAISGATLLPQGRGVCVKVVAAEVRAIRRVLYLAWNYLRTQLLGAPAVMFPK
jgi:urease accessory protein